MKTKLTLGLMLLAFVQQLNAQKTCSATRYQQQEMRNTPSLVQAVQTIVAGNSIEGGDTPQTEASTITIPVVVHILYHDPSQNVSDALVKKQIDILNSCFRRTNADTINTPARFKSVAADCEIQFQLAISDSRGRNTSGIVRKYTPVNLWQDNDQMKFDAAMGSNGWDPKSYLNIWVCDLDRVAGYATMPGGDALKDGVVIDIGVFGTGGGGYDMGKTAVHEVGHWLGLKHIWGDEYCGDDGVSDTPKQGWYNAGCPSGILVSCNNYPTGDMYMNYMDFTDDVCTNMFTLGQKARMRALFDKGGIRASLLTSKGLSEPVIFETPLPDQSPTWLHYQLFPNPATNSMTLDVAYDVRWIGSSMRIVNLQGQQMMQFVISSKVQTIDISKLKPGVYVLAGKKADGVVIQQKFVKL